jgi:hypothetical protein
LAKYIATPLLYPWYLEWLLPSKYDSESLFLSYILSSQQECVGNQASKLRLVMQVLICTIVWLVCAILGVDDCCMLNVKVTSCFRLGEDVNSHNITQLPWWLRSGLYSSIRRLYSRIYYGAHEHNSSIE